MKVLSWSFPSLPDSKQLSRHQPFSGPVLFSVVLLILKAVSSRLQWPLRSSSELDNFSLERIHLCNGLTTADALAQDQGMHHERTSVHRGDCPTFSSHPLRTRDEAMPTELALSVGSSNSKLVPYIRSAVTHGNPGPALGGFPLLYWA